jgi:NAD(P)-dependent dehydrogenase (short-subunit alcohol dehydrogenase family)
MYKTILITGSTDGIGFEAAKTLVSQGHHVLIHGRNKNKLEQAERTLSEISGSAHIESYLADLSSLPEVIALANAVLAEHDKLDILINNAGILKTHEPKTQDGYDVRFVVNTFAPYLLTQKLLPALDSDARVINLSSAAQSPVDPDAMTGKTALSEDMDAYAQSKLALTIWSRTMALSLKENGPVFIAVNPGSLLGTKMVKEGFGMEGKDIHIGSDILTRLALDDEYSTASGQYFDNDAGRFAPPHHDVLDRHKAEKIVGEIESVLSDYI